MTVRIKNAKQSQLVINIEGDDEPLRLEPRGTAEMSEKAFKSVEMQSLLSRGHIREMSAAPVKESVTKPKAAKSGKG